MPRMIRKTKRAAMTRPAAFRMYAIVFRIGLFIMTAGNEGRFSMIDTAFRAYVIIVRIRYGN